MRIGEKVTKSEDSILGLQENISQLEEKNKTDIESVRRKKLADMEAATKNVKISLKQEQQEDKMRFEQKLAKQERATNMIKEMQDREIEETKEETCKIAERLRIQV